LRLKSQWERNYNAQRNRSCPLQKKPDKKQQRETKERVRTDNKSDLVTCNKKRSMGLQNQVSQGLDIVRGNKPNMTVAFELTVKEGKTPPLRVNHKAPPSFTQ